MRRKALFLLLGLSLALVWPAGSEAAGPPEPRLVLGFQPETAVGEQLVLGAYLLDPSENPIRGQIVTFYLEAEFMNTLDRVEIGKAKTDASGLAFVVYEFRLEGKRLVTARFAGNEVFAPMEASKYVVVAPGGATYTEEAPFRMPGATITVVAIVLAVIWSLYLSVMVRFLLISRDGSATDSKVESRD